MEKSDPIALRLKVGAPRTLYFLSSKNNHPPSLPSFRYLYAENEDPKRHLIFRLYGNVRTWHGQIQELKGGFNRGYRASLLPFRVVNLGEIQEAIFEEKSSGFFLHKKKSFS